MSTGQTADSRKHARNCLLRALLMMLLALPTTAEDRLSSDPPDRNVQIETKRQEYRLPESATLRVVNTLGDVRVRSAPQDQLSVVSIVQRFRPNQNDARVSVEEQDRQIDITTHYPSAVASADEHNLAGRLDLTLLVPTGEMLEIETDAGLIEVRGVARSLKARTKSGRIRVSTHHGVEARSETGPLGITLRSASLKRPVHLETRSGQIHVDFPERPLPTLFARTGGKIETDGFPEQSEPSPKNERVSILRVGAPPNVIHVESKSGRIRLRSLPALGLR